MLFTSLFVVPQLCFAQDMYDPIVGGSSPFPPPEPGPGVFVTNEGPGLDTGCSFRSDGPLVIDVEIRTYLGEVDGSGSLLDVDGLLASGALLSRLVELSTPAFDVDFNGDAQDCEPERDIISINGKSLGFLNGDNQIWELNQFSFDILDLKFPSSPGGTATNTIVVDIDTANSGENECWCTALDWCAIKVDVGLVLDIKLQAVDTNVLLELPDQIFFRRELDDTSCQVDQSTARTGLEEYPVSAPMNTTVTVDAEVKVCPPPSPPADVVVDWEVVGTGLRGRQDLSEGEGEIRFRTPGEVGPFDLKLTFRVGSQSEEITRRLYVTLRESLRRFEPRHYHKNATTWADGGTDEETSLERLIAGIFSYGQMNWEYRYARNPSQCNAAQLLAENIACNYSDCYVFTDAFEAMSAVLGIGGLLERQLFGLSPIGGASEPFITTGAPSIDPNFRGNVGPKSDPCNEFGTQNRTRYRFGSHSVTERLRSNVFYDQTFRGIYDGNSTEGIEWYLLQSTGRVPCVLFEWDSRPDASGAITSERRLNLPGPYSGWGNFVYDTVPVPFAKHQAVPAGDRAGGVVIQSIASAPVDEDGNGIYEVLEVIPEIVISSDVPAFTVDATLLKDGVVIANRPAFRSSISSTADVSGEAGVHEPRLTLSGEQIFESGEDGPYTARIEILGTTNVAEEPTAPYLYQDFGELGLSIENVVVVGVDGDGDSLFDDIRVTTDVFSRRALEDYQAVISIWSPSEDLVALYENVSFGSGTSSLESLIGGESFARASEPGPYSGLITVQDVEGVDLASAVFETPPFVPGDFFSPIERGEVLDDEGIDTQGNSLFESLRVTIGTTVTADGTIGAVLLGDGENEAVPSRNTVQVQAGSHQGVFEFDGPSIRSLMMDGPYKILLEFKGESPDQLLLDGETSAYSHADFSATYEDAPIVLTGSTTEEPLDTDNDGLYDALRVCVEVQLLQSDTYEWSATLRDGLRTRIDLAADQEFLSAGVANLCLTFDGSSIGENGMDGPYEVRALAVFGRSSGASLTAERAAVTEDYFASQFDGFVPGLHLDTLPTVWQESWLSEGEGSVRVYLGGWPEQVEPSGVDPNTLLLNGGVPSSFSRVLPSWPNLDGPVLECHFDRREAVSSSLPTEEEGLYRFGVSGELFDARVFDYSDFVSIVEDANRPSRAGDTVGLSLRTNPIQDRAVFDIVTPLSQPVSIRIFDATGREIHSISAKTETSSTTVLEWNAQDRFGRSVPSGIYYYTAKVGRQPVQSGRVIVQR